MKIKIRCYETCKMGQCWSQTWTPDDHLVWLYTNMYGINSEGKRRTISLEYEVYKKKAEQFLISNSLEQFSVDDILTSSRIQLIWSKIPQSKQWLFHVPQAHQTIRHSSSACSLDPFIFATIGDSHSHHHHDSGRHDDSSTSHHDSGGHHH